MADRARSFTLFPSGSKDKSHALCSYSTKCHKEQSPRTFGRYGKNFHENSLTNTSD